MIKKILYKGIERALSELYAASEQNIQFQKTKRDFEGDITLVVFPLLHASKTGAEETAGQIGSHLKEHVKEVINYNVIKGFLNIEISQDFWFNCFVEVYNTSNYGVLKANEDAPTYLVEYSSPNTNKPIHLGHLRNNFLGYSVSEILKASGKNVKKVQIINDRGIHICKSMVAWQEFGNGETPESSGLKGDHLVGKYYVEFDQNYRKEVDSLIATGMQRDQAEKQAPILKRAQEMLVQWEEKDSQVRDLWQKMNCWVYEGFAITYDRIGVDFDKNYYESDTYLLGKKVIDIGLDKDVFYKKADGSVWIDLSDEGLDQKILLRADGTAVYMTQDIGTAIQRYKDFGFSHMTYTVANEQDYHFKVLFLILEKLGFKWAANCSHLSYGMVDLPTGRMKSREGTVVDADDFVQEMVDTAKGIAKELGKLDDLSELQANELYEIVGLGALKYFVLKVDPKKRILFDPEASVDFNGNTGPFIQYTYARIQSLKRKYSGQVIMPVSVSMIEKEREIIKQLTGFPNVIQEAAINYSPALVANFVYDLVKNFNHYYQSTSILTAQSEELINFRLGLSLKVGEVIKTAMNLLGVRVPERM
tara:strand:+ start:15020 stop:16789 length:1770 start_codon:yes stop_codon:yes gene_type:complete